MNSDEEAVWQVCLDRACSQVKRLEAAFATQREKARELDARLKTHTSHAELVVLVRDFLRSTFGI